MAETSRLGSFGFRILMLSMVACACPGIGPAKDAGGATAENPENFRLEITGAGWLVNPSGTIQSSGTPVNLVTDLGAQPHHATFYGQLVFKPGRKHRIVVEGTPFRINGYNVVNRSISYHGQTFNFSETL